MCCFKGDLHLAVGAAAPRRHESVAEATVAPAHSHISQESFAKSIRTWQVLLGLSVAKWTWRGL